MRPLFPAAIILWAALTVAVGALQPSRTCDLLIANARVLDGTGAAAVEADVAIAGDRIAAVGDLDNVGAARIVDADGLTLAPGFIDVHSHAAQGLSGALHTAVPLLAQGVTTVFVNHDGGGAADLAVQRAAFENHGAGVNVVQFVPHGSIRRAVMGLEDRAPTPEEIVRMAAMVRTGLEAGGVGLSTGLFYAPGSYAKTEEVIALAEVTADGGGVYASHIRDEGDYSTGVVASVQEVIRIAEEARITGVVSHMKALGPKQWGLATTLTRAIEDARARGVRVFADQYPYEATGTSLASALVPRWAQAGGRERFLERLKSGDRARIGTAIAENLVRRGGPKSLVLSSYGKSASTDDRTLDAIATARGLSPADTVLALLEEQDDWPAVSFSMSEDDIRHIMRQPWTMTCSDGELSPPNAGWPHPRGYGAFARKLGVYVRERRVIDLPTAIRSMTGLPAEVFGMTDRGVVRAGAIADLVVFDPDTIADRATYDSPHRLAAGVHYVLVNGVIAIDAGKSTGATAGRVVRRERH